MCGWLQQMQGYATPEQKDTFNLMGFNSSSTPSTATNIDLGSLPVRLPWKVPLHTQNWEPCKTHKSCFGTRIQNGT